MSGVSPAKTAAVVYRSHTGRTRLYAEEIAAHLRTLGLVAQVSSVGDCDMARLATVDYLLTRLLDQRLLRRPPAPRRAVAGVRPRPAGDVHARVGLFTTYQLLTGSMFARMREALAGRIAGADARAQVAQQPAVGR